MNKQKITIIALSVTLFVMAQYIIYEKIMETRQQELENTFQNGYNKGLSDAAIIIYKQTENCQIATVTMGNFTKNIFDLSCLKNLQENMTH